MLDMEKNFLLCCWLMHTIWGIYAWMLHLESLVALFMYQISLEHCACYRHGEKFPPMLLPDAHHMGNISMDAQHLESLVAI